MYPLLSFLYQSWKNPGVIRLIALGRQLIDNKWKNDEKMSNSSNECWRVGDRRITSPVGEHVLLVYPCPGIWIRSVHRLSSLVHFRDAVWHALNATEHRLFNSMVDGHQSIRLQVTKKVCWCVCMWVYFAITWCNWMFQVKPRHSINTCNMAQPKIISFCH